MEILASSRSPPPQTVCSLLPRTLSLPSHRHCSISLHCNCLKVDSRVGGMEGVVKRRSPFIQTPAHPPPPSRCHNIPRLHKLQACFVLLVFVLFFCFFKRTHCSFSNLVWNLERFLSSFYFCFGHLHDMMNTIDSQSCCLLSPRVRSEILLLFFCCKNHVLFLFCAAFHRLVASHFI